MDKQLFEYTGGCDAVSDSYWQFMDCRLKVRMGRYEPGDCFKMIEIDAEKMRVKLYGPEGDEPMDIFELTVTVGRKVQLDESVESEAS